MKFLFKLLAAPVVVLLTAFVWLCSGLLYCSAWIFGLAASLVGILGVAVLITGSVQNGICLLLIALAVSPVGLPMVAAWVIGQIQKIRYAIQDRVYG